MKRQLSDEQFDKMMKTLVVEASADDALIDDITASPTLWCLLASSAGLVEYSA